MSEMDELIGRLEKAQADIGLLPVDPQWMSDAVRHCQRNMDLDVQEGFQEPDRYAGGPMAAVINALPEIIAALRARASKDGEGP